MNIVKIIKKLSICILIIFSIKSVQTVAFAQTDRQDEFLQKAFAALEETPPPLPNPLQQKLIDQIIDEIEKAASHKRFYAPETEIAEQIGWAGFTSIAPLLKNQNAWIRAFSARTLFGLDREKSLPFLIGLLSDKGIFDYMNDVPGYTVSNHAASLIGRSIHGTIYFKTPVDERNDPLASLKAVQNYYWFHISFCDWTNNPQNRVCFINYLNIIEQLENTRFPSSPASSDGYVGINYASIGNLSNSSVFKLGAPVEINLGFTHRGNRIMRIRWDVRDQSIHKFKLIGPNGVELKLNPDGLPLLPELVPVLQPQWGKSSSLGKDLNLSTMYELKQRGKYTFYYEYLPPVNREKEEQFRPVHAWQWNGKEYVNYYEFIVE